MEIPKVFERRQAYGLLEAPVQRSLADGEVGRKLPEIEPARERRLHPFLSACDQRVRVPVLVNQRRVRRVVGSCLNSVFAVLAGAPPAKVSTIVRSALGWHPRDHSCGHLLDSVVRNSEFVAARLAWRYQQKCQQIGRLQ
ncbi:hypothetical protein [Bradyrhizobium sp. B117]|uniref:hypothetical protein n=1 Tax=Bradyrhizobium sp. B117 TaxID=3140246 RepID=UPI003184288E